MLSAKKTLDALRQKQASWQQAQRQATHHLQLAREALSDLAGLSYQDLSGRLEANVWCGAKPTSEHESYPGQVVPFGRRFTSHQSAREWAATVLLGQATFAADGSQISPLSDYLLPIAAVQAAWYLNPHSPDARHVKDLQIEVLIGNERQDGDETFGALVQTRRFALEVEAIASFVESSTGAEPKPVSFYDGPLVVSFARTAAARQEYVQAITRLLDASEEARVPVVGYVASSAARDVVDMLHAAGLLQGSAAVHDASLLGAELRHWGDRSVVYLCARDDDVLSRYPGHDQAVPDYRIAFCYLRTASACPARLELPSWLIRDEAELARVLDVVRAECIIGTGYPYPIEAADQAAYLGGAEREAFARLVAAFAEEQGLDLGVAPKAASKRRRRR